MFLLVSRFFIGKEVGTAGCGMVFGTHNGIHIIVIIGGDHGDGIPVLIIGNGIQGITFFQQR